MRIADVDMTESNQKCPYPLQRVTHNKENYCAPKRIREGGCSTPDIQFRTHGIHYTRICGRIRGYQEGSTDAFGTPIVANKGKRGVTINEAYVDGISLTYGSPSRTHIWTFASGLTDEHTGFKRAQCPCSQKFSQRDGTYRPRVPDFVGKNLFCDTGNQGLERTKIPKISKSFMGHALWDGKGCSTLNGCCDKRLGLPWFSRSFEPLFCEDIQLRVCNDEGTDNERTLIDQIELYVQ